MFLQNIILTVKDRLNFLMEVHLQATEELTAKIQKIGLLIIKKNELYLDSGAGYDSYGLFNFSGKIKLSEKVRGLISTDALFLINLH